MAMGRRLALALPFLAGSAAAQPARPLRPIVPFPPGGTTDLLARLAELGLEPLGGGADVFTRFIAEKTARWRPVIAAGITVE